MSQSVFDVLPERVWSQFQSPGLIDLREKVTNLRKESMKLEYPEPHVWVTGSKGTDREGIARKVHQNSRNPRAPFRVLHGSFIKSGIQLNFSGEAGTLYIENFDMLGTTEQMSMIAQIKSSHVRLIVSVSTGMTPSGEMAQFFSNIRPNLAPMQDRGLDRSLVARELASFFFVKHGKKAPEFAPQFDQEVNQHNWLGNDVELVCALERLAVIHYSGTVSSLGLSASSTMPQQYMNGGGTPGARPTLTIVEGGGSSTGAPAVPPLGLAPTSSVQFPTVESVPFDGYMAMKKRWSQEFERAYLLKALERHQGNVSAAAREAKIDRSNFLRLLRRHAIRADIFRHDTGDATSLPGTGTDDSQEAA